MHPKFSKYIAAKSNGFKTLEIYSKKGIANTEATPF